MSPTTGKTMLNARCNRSNDAHVPNFEQPKCFTNASPQRLVHDKMQYLETIADAALRF